MKPPTYEFGEFTLDVERGAVFRAGKEIRLRPKVYETLKFFLEHPGRLVGKQELMQAVWPDAFVTDDSLVQCTLELRRALGDRGQQILKTVPRRGYLFSAPVVQRTPQPEPAHADYASEPRAQRESPAIAHKHVGLPVPRTPLIDREQQLAESSALLLKPGIRLLSLTGAGGSGKTRLALALAKQVAEHFPGGVQFVALATIRDADLVASAIAEALDVHVVPHRTLPQLIADRLRNSGPFLLVLDNFEQVLPAATMLAEILEECPSLKILVTSRASLRIYGEQEFQVSPLAEEFAVALFAQRAAAVQPGFSVTPDNAPVVREICARLDGLPLAIELAAARAKLLPPSAILDRLQNRLQLLTSGALDLPERQQTLRNTINWSYDLLCEGEQRLLRRLAVFVGGCTLEAAEAVCNTSRDLGMDLLDALASLVDQNLVQRSEEAGSEPRFTMLETIREYALERLIQSEELASVRRAHAAYCLVLAEEGNAELNPAERSRWLEACDHEIDNFRSALDWLVQTREQEWGLRLSSALFRFWDMREHLNEGRARLEQGLALAGDQYPRERARVLLFIGALATAQGDFQAAADFLRRGLALYEELGDQWGIAASLNALAVSARDWGDYASAQSNFERSLACWRLLPDRAATARCLHNLANVVRVRGDYARATWALREATELFEALGDRSGAAWSLNQQGDIAREQGHGADAHKLYERALAVFREAGDRWGIARSLTDLAAIEVEQRKFSEALQGYRRALEIYTDLGHKRGIARALEGFACLALAEGQPARALKLAAVASNLRRMINAFLPQAEQEKLDTALAPAWESLGDAEGKKTWAEGCAMSIEQAIQYVGKLETPRSA